MTKWIGEVNYEAALVRLRLRHESNKTDMDIV